MTATRSLGRELRARCAEQMRDEERGMGGQAWLFEAFMATPREAYVPDRVWWPQRDKDGLYPVLDRRLEPQRWLHAVYLPGFYLITQINDGSTPLTGPADGAFTSSISAPAVTVEVLRHLDPQPGHKILEIGTGTGYSTALLAHRVGAGQVTSIEIDSALAGHARQRLAAQDLSPRLLVGDGEHVDPDGGFYDRIVATASVRAIPRAWITQLAPGGVLVAPLDSPYGHDLLIRLTATGDGTATGVAVAPVEFMRTRGQRTPQPHEYLGWPTSTHEKTIDWTELAITYGADGQHITHPRRPPAAS
ncbi:methyltransferase domain-containing protein [Streptomyces sp. NPDC001941]|uniref:methyltransferase domain-containing protein n=1 Tax=Streptomyces sp. NPDC001941 TaxID=3154659 RepID=UPI00331ACEBE